MSKNGKVVIVIVLIVAVLIVIAIKQNRSGRNATMPVPDSAGQQVPEEFKLARLTGKGLPVLIDLGAGECVPCKMMAPILKELKKGLEGKLVVHVLDVGKFPGLAEQYQISLIPTQIFYDASGKELFRHPGYFSKGDILGKWKELGVDFSEPDTDLPAFKRLLPAQVDGRPKEKICYMCDGDIDPRTLVTVQTGKGPVRLCSPHCYFIMYSCLTEDKTGFENKVWVTDWSTGESVPATAAVFLCGQDETTGSPWIKAFADREATVKERSAEGGSILAFAALEQKELSHRCGFCDRACYPQDAAEVIVEGGVHTWGCCSHCALGVAARTGEDIEVHGRDRLTGEEIVIATLNGKVALLEPPTAVAWFGQRQKADGTWSSAGCFHQGFFANPENLKQWLEQNPYETGRLISISQALADKMRLSPEQIQKACKIDQCVPKRVP